jgi:tight adherence protein B
LADVLDTISKTIRERIQLKGQIRSITSQQKMTGTVLSALPFVMGTLLFLISPDYMSGILQPGWPMLLPISAVIMVVLGNIVMNQVTKIEI